MAVAALRIANAGAGGGGGGATNPAGAGTVIWEWQAGQGICIPAYSGPHWMCCWQEGQANLISLIS
jgi:hypothetical protein